MCSNNSDLDTRWIDETETELATTTSLQPRSPQTTLTTTFVYINANDSIDKVATETHELRLSTMSYEQILQLIQRKKTTPAAKYKLIEILLYVVDVDPSQISHYVSSPEPSFIKVCPSYSDIQIAETLSIFHKINALYFVFKEKQKIMPRPILKQHPSEDPETSPIKKTRRYQSTRAHTRRVIFV